MKLCSFAATCTICIAFAFSSCGGGGGSNGGKGESESGSSSDNPPGTVFPTGLPGNELIPAEYSYLILKLDLPTNGTGSGAMSLSFELRKEPSGQPYSGDFILTAQEGIDPALIGMQGTWEHEADNTSATFLLKEMRGQTDAFIIELWHVEASVSDRQDTGGNTSISGSWQDGSLLISENGEALVNHTPGTDWESAPPVLTLTFVR